jgi:hypothetical protein
MLKPTEENSDTKDQFIGAHLLKTENTKIWNSKGKMPV